MNPTNYRWIYVAGFLFVSLLFMRIAFAAGGKTDGEGFNPWVYGDDDYILSMSETHLTGERGFLVIDALHSTLLGKPETSASVIQFLKHDQFTFG